MPCDTIREVTVELKAADKGVLLRGLAAAGFRNVQDAGHAIYAVSKRGTPVEIERGQITVRAGQEYVVNEVKRAYASEAIRTAAKRFNFNTKQDTTDANHITLNRRTF